MRSKDVENNITLIHWSYPGYWPSKRPSSATVNTMLSGYRLTRLFIYSKDIASNKIIFFHSWLWIRQNKYNVDIKWNVYHQCNWLVYFHSFLSNVVKKWFIELLCKNAKIRFLPPTPVFMRNYIFYKNITWMYVLVNLMLLKY